MSTGTDVGVGDSEVPFLAIAPADNTTLATLVANRPDGMSATVSVSGGTLVAIPDTSPVQYSQRWTADQPVVYSLPGRWVLHWKVTGTGEGTEDLEVWVVASPIAGGPTWAPGRSRVANYVPHRTLERSISSGIASQDTYDLSFTGNTIPSGLAVDRLIADGIAWVTSRVYPLNVRAQDAASVIVALYAAAAVERGTPDDAQSLQRANDLEKRMDALLAGLIVANTAANADDGVAASPPAILPRWSFPAADRRFDDSRYF